LRDLIQGKEVKEDVPRDSGGTAKRPIGTREGPIRSAEADGYGGPGEGCEGTEKGRIIRTWRRRAEEKEKAKKRSRRD